MEALQNYEVVAGIFLAVYFFVRGIMSFKVSKSGNGNGTTLSSLARDHVDQKIAAQQEALVSRQEFIEHKKTLEQIQAKIEAWDDLIHAGDFGCKWQPREVGRLLDRLEYVESEVKRFNRYE